MTEPTAETEAAATAGRGRPRPETTIARDAQVLAYLTSAEGGKTRKEIVTGTELPGNEVYLSLYRLRVSGAIKREGSTWVVVTAEVSAE